MIANILPDLPLLHALGWTIVYFLWQGAAIGLLAGATLTALRGRAATTRYVVACLALLACAVSFVVTVVVELGGGGSATVASRLGSQPASPHVPASGTGIGPSTTHASAISSGWLLDLIAVLWALGVLFFALRFARQWLATHRLRSVAVTSPDEPWLTVFNTLKKELGITRAVGFLRSGIAEAPMVIGWLSPVVLIPASAFTSLTPDQLRAVLVHELSHIRRRDDLVNAAQIIVETVLFFHPVVWWLSGQIRLEREHCCDDATVRFARNPRLVAEALTRLETLRSPLPLTALAANGGPLMNRIARILNVRAHVPGPAIRWSNSLALVAGLLASAAVFSQAAVNAAPSSNPATEALRNAVAAGSMSAEDARVVYDTTVFPGSAAQQKIEGGFAKATALIEAGVTAGKLTEQAAQAKLDVARADLAEQQHAAFRIEVLGMSTSEAYVDAVRTKLEALVRSGAMTQEVAAAKLATTVQGVAAKEQATAKLKAIAAELGAKVKAGQMAREVADQKLAMLKGAAGTDAKTKAYVQAAAAKCDALVATGEMTREAADTKMTALKQEIAGKAKTAYLDAVAAKLDALVASGQMTREVADAKLAATTAGK